MVQIPFILLSPLWPDLTARAFAGHDHVGGVHGGLPCCRSCAWAPTAVCRAATSSTIAALFALNPMIVFYGSNGMSEAPFIFFVTWAVRRLIMWMVDDDVHHLIAAGGIAMGVVVPDPLRRGRPASPPPASSSAPPPTCGPAPPAVASRAAGPADGQRTGLRGVRRLGGGQLAHHRRGVRAVHLPVRQHRDPGAVRRQPRRRVSAAALAFAAVCITLLAPTLIPIAVWADVSAGAAATGQCWWCRCAIYGAVLAFQALQLRLGLDVSVPAVLHRRDPVRRHAWRCWRCPTGCRHAASGAAVRAARRWARSRCRGGSARVRAGRAGIRGRPCRSRRGG